LLNFRNNLLAQPVNDGYLVVYTKSGSEIAATWLKKGERFVLEHSTMYGSFEKEEEAIYLTSILNSSAISKGIEELQSFGLKGKRNIHKLPFNLPIPIYDPTNYLHRKLVELGKEARDKAMSLKEHRNSFLHTGPHRYSRPQILP